MVSDGLNHFASLVRHLRNDFPDYRFSVRRVPYKVDYGRCHKQSNGSFHIRVRKDLEEGVQCLILVHEIAHMLSWETDKHPSDHGGRFGLAYSRAWQSYLRWLET